MNCEKCGSPLKQGSAYCLNCGKVQGEPERAAPAAHTVYVPPAGATPPQQAAQMIPPPQTAQAPPPPAAPPAFAPQPQGSAQGGGFFSSPAGKTLAVVLALLVAAGAAVGAVFLLRGGSGYRVDDSTMEVWEDFQDLLEKDGKSLDPITYDPKSLWMDQSDLAESVKAVKDLQKDLKNAKSTGGGKGKADELAEALESYEEYLAQLHKYYGDLATALDKGTLKDQNVSDQLSSQLDRAQTLALETKSSSEAFLKDNDKAKSKRFDPEILALTEELKSGLRDQVALALSAEKQRLEAEKAAAEQAAAEAAAAAAASGPAKGRKVYTCSPYDGACAYCGNNSMFYDESIDWWRCAACGAEWPIECWNPWDGY